MTFSKVDEDVDDKDELRNDLQKQQQQIRPPDLIQPELDPIPVVLVRRCPPAFTKRADKVQSE